MVKGGRGVVAAAIVTTMWLSTSDAVAATEVGDRCEANASVVAGFEGILFPLSTGTPGALPVSVPAPGVVTQWTVRKQGSDTFAERLKVLRLSSELKKVTIVAESPLEDSAAGTEHFPDQNPG